MSEKLEGILSEGYGIMPIIILRSDKLNDKQKLLYCLISSLCAEKGFCRASNKYLGNVLNVGARAISKNINSLAELGLIIVEIKHGKERRIKLNSRISKKLLGFLNNDSENSLPSEKSLPLGNITSSDSEKSLAPLGKITSTPNEYGELGPSENPGKSTSNNIIEYTNNNIKENNKKKVSTANAVSSTPNGFAINNCTEENVDGVKLSKTQIKQQAIDKLRHRMENEGYSATVVELIMDFDEVKKGTKLHKQTEKGIKAFITTLNTRDTEQGKIDVLNTAISGPTQGIRANKYRKTIPTNNNTKQVAAYYY